MSVLNIKQSYRIYNYTGLPRKDETLVNHQNTHLNSETKDKLQIDIILEFWVVFTVSFFVGIPLYMYVTHCWSNQNI